MALDDYTKLVFYFFMLIYQQRKEEFFSCEEEKNEDKISFCIKILILFVMAGSDIVNHNCFPFSYILH